MTHFAAVINGEEEPLVSGLEGLKSLEVVEGCCALICDGGGKFNSSP